MLGHGSAHHLSQHTTGQHSTAEDSMMPVGSLSLACRCSCTHEGPVGTAQQHHSSTCTAYTHKTRSVVLQGL